MRISNHRLRWLLFGVAASAAVGLMLVQPAERPQPAPESTAARQSVAQSDPRLKQYTLSNGMELIVIPNKRIPAVSHVIWVKAGAAEDPRGKSGIAHYLEHMMFQGTKEVPAGEYSKEISRYGGEQNAFTSQDVTAYYVNIAKERLERVMQLEVDRFLHIEPNEKDFAREREVITEERRLRTDNVPSALLSEQMQATLFLNHSYHTPTIGWMQEMQQLSPHDARSFLSQYYTPKNMVLVIAGDVDADAVYALSEKYYGKLKGNAPPPRLLLEEPVRKGMAHITLRHENVKQVQWVRDILAPSLQHGDKTDAMALTLASQLLGQGSASVLYQTLVVEEKLATAVASYYSPFRRGPSTFSIEVTPAPNVETGRIAQRVQDIMESIATRPFDHADMRRAQTLLDAETVFAWDSLDGVARWVGYLRALDLPMSYFSEWSAMTHTVTAAQVQTAMQHLLQAPTVTGELLPPEATP